MTHSVAEVMKFVRLGREHWKQIIAGEIKPEMPEEFNNADVFLQQMFAKGAVEEMDIIHDKNNGANYGSDWPKSNSVW